MLRVVQSEFLRDSLEWFNNLKDVRQEEIGASTVGRLENFVTDPLIRAILTEQTHCLDVGDVIRNHKKLCIDVPFYNPLVPDDAKTMLRLLINNILAHRFAIPKAEQTPTILLLDEVREYATEDLAVALTLGRELKLFVVMAHQFPSQLKLSADDSHLFEAVQECCRTKIVFGGLHVSEFEGIVKELMIDQFNPYFIKDERKALELEPIETTPRDRNLRFYHRRIVGHESRDFIRNCARYVARRFQDERHERELEQYRFIRPCERREFHGLRR